MLQPPLTGFGRTTNEYYHGNPAVEICARSAVRTARRAPGDSPSRRKIFVCTPEGCRWRRAVRAEDSVDARHARLPPAAHRSRYPDAASSFYREGRADAEFRHRHPARDRAHPGRAQLPLPRRARPPAGLAAGSAYRLSDLDLASRLSFFLVEQHPRRRTARCGRSRQAARSRQCWSSRCGACCATRDRRRWSTISPAAGWS